MDGLTVCFNTEDTESAEEKKKETSLFAEPAVGDGLVGVDAAIAEEGPIAAGLFRLRGIAFDDQNFFLIVGSFFQDAAERIGNERVAPEFEAGIAFFRFAFEADAVHNCNINAVGDGVRALNGAPGIKLRGAKFGFFARMPADAGGIEDDLRACKRGEARTLRVPLIPANLNADATVLGVEIGEAEVAGREIKFFVVERIVGDVHFAVFAEERAVGVEDGAGVVINAGSAAFEEGDNENNFFSFGDLRERVGGRAGNGLREVEEVGVFDAAEIFAQKKFVERDDLRAARSRFANFVDGARKIFVGIVRAAHLHEANRKFVWHEN